MEFGHPSAEQLNAAQPFADEAIVEPHAQSQGGQIDSSPVAGEPLPTASTGFEPEVVVPEQRDPELEALTDRLMHGDASALANLFERYSEAMRRYAQRLVRDTAFFDADDAVQATFLKAVDAVQRGGFSEGNPRGWLFTILHNTLVDNGRRHNNIRMCTLEGGEGIPMGGPGTEETVMSRIGLISLLRAMQGLVGDEVMEQFFETAVLDQRPVDHARRTDTHPTTTNTRATKARKRFQAAMDRQLFENGIEE